MAATRRTRSFNIEIVILGIDSDWDDVTKRAADYREKNLYPYLRSKGFSVTVFRGELARRHFVAPETRKPNVGCITGVGHGSQDSFTGDYGDPILQVGNYSDEEVRGKIVHFLSCKTAQQLGPDMVGRGTRAYFGYDVNFTYWPEHADVFFECDTEIDKALADGQTAAEAYVRAIALYELRIEELREKGLDDQAATLEVDRHHLCAPSVNAARWGDPKARLE